jgi:hypothetical protein
MIDPKVAARQAAYWKDPNKDTFPKCPKCKLRPISCDGKGLVCAVCRAEERLALGKSMRQAWERRRSRGRYNSK